MYLLSLFKCESERVPYFLEISLWAIIIIVILLLFFFQDQKGANYISWRRGGGIRGFDYIGFCVVHVHIRLSHFVCSFLNDANTLIINISHVVTRPFITTNLAVLFIHRRHNLLQMKTIMWTCPV